MRYVVHPEFGGFSGSNHSCFYSKLGLDIANSSTVAERLILTLCPVLCSVRRGRHGGDTKTNRDSACRAVMRVMFSGHSPSMMF